MSKNIKFHNNEEVGDKLNIKYRIIKHKRVINKTFTKEELFERYNFKGKDIDDFLNLFKQDFSNCKSFKEVQRVERGNSYFSIAFNGNLEEFVNNLVVKQFNEYLTNDYNIKYCKKLIEKNIISEFKSYISFYQNMWLDSNGLFEFHNKNVFIFSKKEICSIKKYIRKDLKRLFSHTEIKKFR